MIRLISIVLTFILFAFQEGGKEPQVIYLVGDSTMADYSDNYDPGKDYYTTRFPVTGWGQVFQELFKYPVEHSGPIIRDSVRIVDRARGGRSTRTFFQEGRWRNVYENLMPGDLV